MLTPNDIAKCERWFLDHGLPYFVEAGHATVRQSLGPRQIMAWSGLAVVAGAVGGTGASVAGASVLGASLIGLVVAAGVVLARGLWVFRLGVIGRWAVRHAWSSRQLLVPLATRALPFLLLFITFLFINTEVWQVASALSRPLLWSCVAIFVLIAVGFLAPSFEQEINRMGAEVDGEELAATCAGTPVASASREILAEPALVRSLAGVDLARLQRSNLLIVLFVTQAVQVLALALIVFGFFVAFGSLAIRPSVIEAWVGHAPTYQLDGLHLISNELFSVAVFLSGFAGLYFTVQAVIDQNYRSAFFSRIEHDLRQAVAVRKVYVALRTHLAVTDA